MSTEVVANKSGCIDFTPYSREGVIPTDQDRIRKLNDIRLTLFSEPTLAPLVDAQRFVGPVDVRLYINEYDVTTYLRESLKEQIRGLPPALVRTQYLAGVQRYLSFVQSFADPPPVGGDLAIATTYAAMADWGNAFNSLGDRTLGWSGNLHALNFIFRFIPILPISLADVWERYVANAGGNPPETLSEFERLVITLSQGMAPSQGAIDPAVIPGGRLHYRLSYLYPNPLEPRLRAIAMELRQLSQIILALQTNYLDGLSAGLHTVEANFVAHTNATTAALQNLRNTVDQIAGP